MRKREMREQGKKGKSALLGVWIEHRVFHCMLERKWSSSSSSSSSSSCSSSSIASNRRRMAAGVTTTAASAVPAAVTPVTVTPNQ